MSHDLFSSVFEKASSYEANEPPEVLGEDEPTAIVETADGDDSDDEPEKPAEKISSVTVMNLFRNPDAHPIVLDLALLRKYGPEWLGWELETLEVRIPQDFHTPTISDLNMEKVQACKALHLVDTFWLQWEVFAPCTVALNGLYADFKVMQVPTVEQCMVAVDIANRIREDVPWSLEVKRYLGVVHRFDDILCVQPPLEFVEIDVEGLPLDCARVAALWPLARRMGRPPESGTIEAEQLRRMLAAREYLEASRAQLRAQLSVIRHV